MNLAKLQEWWTLNPAEPGGLWRIAHSVFYFKFTKTCFCLAILLNCLDNHNFEKRWDADVPHLGQTVEWGQCKQWLDWSSCEQVEPHSRSSSGGSWSAGSDWISLASLAHIQSGELQNTDKSQIKAKMNPQRAWGAHDWTIRFYESLLNPKVGSFSKYQCQDMQTKPARVLMLN